MSARSIGDKSAVISELPQVFESQVAGTNEDENVVVGRKVCFEPDNSAEVEMRRRLVEQEQVRLDEKRPGERDAHPPATRHVLRRLGHHRRREAETVEDRTGLCLEHGGVHLLNLLINGLERELVDVVGNREILGELLKPLNLSLGRSNNVVKSVNVRGLDGTANEVDVDVVGNLDVTLGDRLEEGRLKRRGGQQEARASAASPRRQTRARRWRTNLSAAVLSKETVPLTVARVARRACVSARSRGSQRCEGERT